MSIFKELFPENLYHSYLIEGDPENISKELISYLLSKKIIREKNLNNLIQIFDNLTISDLSVAREWHNTKSFSQDRRFCIIGTKFINREAEHALLKILEEPKENTHFILITPNVDILLPTIHSRTHIIRINESLNNNFKKAQEFIEMNLKEKIDQIAKIIKSHENDEDSSLLRFEAIEFLNNIEKIIYKDFKKNPTNKNISFVLSEITNVRKYLALPGCSVKMLLEHIAIIME